MGGVALRLGRLFNRASGRSFVAAIDHGLTLGVPKGAERAVETVERVIALEPDALLISPGLLAQSSHLFAFRGAPAPIVRADFIINDPRLKPLGEQYRLLISPSDALVLGADALVLFLIMEVEQGSMFADNVQTIGKTAQEAHRRGLPVIVEVTLWGSRAANPRDPDLLAMGCRMAAEIGADAIKTEYTGDPATMIPIVEGCPVPILVLGGPKSNAPDALVDATRDAMTAGARGVVYGRNIWQADDPQAMAGRLRAVIHDTADRR